MIGDLKFLKFRGVDIPLFPQPDGSYVDAQGTVYPAMLFDPGFCGVSPFETGKGDPFHIRACRPHDLAFSRAKIGYAIPGETTWSVFRDFSGAVLGTMLESAYALVMGIPYIVIGGVGGAFRYSKLRKDHK